MLISLFTDVSRIPDNIEEDVHTPDYEYLETLDEIYQEFLRHDPYTDEYYTELVDKRDEYIDVLKEILYNIYDLHIYKKIDGDEDDISSPIYVDGVPVDEIDDDLYEGLDGLDQLSDLTEKGYDNVNIVLLAPDDNDLFKAVGTSLKRRPILKTFNIKLAIPYVVGGVVVGYKAPKG